MRVLLLGGVAGWLVGVAPLLAVNLVDYFGVYYFPNPFLAGAAGLTLGLLLGGVVAGLVGARARGAGRGVRGAGTTGLVAATLYAVSVIGLMEAARSFDALPPAVTKHPLRVSAGILFLASLLLLVALLTGALAGVEEATSVSQATQPTRTASSSRMPETRGVGSSPVYGRPPYSQPRGVTSATPSRPAGPRPSGPQWQAPDASDSRYEGARVAGPPSRPAQRSDSTNHRR